MKKVILDLCGGTGAWSRPYRESGEYEVHVITLPENDVLTYKPPKNVYGILAAPPCDQFSYAKTTGAPRDLIGGWSVLNACMRIIAECQFDLESPYAKITPLKFWAIENPYGLMRFFLGKPAFEFDPWEFGDPHKKRTQLWGHFIPPIKTYGSISSVMSDEEIELCKTNSRKLPKFDHMPSKEIAPEMIDRYNRKARRAITPSGFANAFFKTNR